MIHIEVSRLITKNHIKKVIQCILSVVLISGFSGLISAPNALPKRLGQAKVQVNHNDRAPGIYATWEEGPEILHGLNWGADALSGGLGYGDHFLDSTVPDSEMVEVELRISPAETTYCQTYLTNQGYTANGVGIFPGSAWDVSDPENPRRLNLSFSELSDPSNGRSPNRFWDPDTTRAGGQEYLFIMASDYDSSGKKYDNMNRAVDGDVYYVLWTRLIEGYSIPPQDTVKLRIHLAHIRNLHAIPSSKSLRLYWVTQKSQIEEFQIFTSLSQTPDSLIATVSSDMRTFHHDNLAKNSAFQYQVRGTGPDKNILYTSTIISAETQRVSGRTEFLGNLHHRGSYGDVWGYTDQETGKEYALLCVRGAGLSIIDISKMPPREVGFAPAPEASVDSKDVKVYEHYAVLINEQADAQIIDLSMPADPETVATIPLPSGAGAHNCFVDGDHLYIVGDHGDGGLTIFDLSDPNNPEQVGNYDPKYYHDIYVRDTLAYASAIFGGGVDILDVSDKSEVDSVGNVFYENNGAHNAWPSTDGSYLFVGDEVGAAGNWIRVFDISSLQSPEQVGSYIADPEAITHNFYAHNDILYVAYYTEGVRFVDISDPANPEELGFYETYFGDEYGFNGVWSVYPYFESGKIIASDMEKGLYVMRFDSTGIVGSEEEQGLRAPQKFALGENYPNPFNSSTRIPFILADRSEVTLTVWDIRGRLVRKIRPGKLEAGRHHISFSGAGLPSGVYYYRLTTNQFSATEKMLLLK